MLMTSFSSRRRFLVQSGLAAGGSALSGSLLLSACSTPSGSAPMIGASDAERPKMPSGIQFGDVTGDRAIVWGRSDRLSRMIVEYDTTDRFTNPSRVMGPYATAATDFTTRVDLSGLPLGQSIFTRVRYVDPNNSRIQSETRLGQFRTPPLADGKRPVRFHWSGDMAGQGWGINPEFGGVKIYEAMRRRNPDFFVHNGDTIYADRVIKPEQKAEGGRIWRNIVTEEVSKVAETLKEYRGRHSYNLLDEHVLRFSAEVPQVWQWDDHDVTNNWSASKDLNDYPEYKEKDLNKLIAFGRQAFLEYSPMRSDNLGGVQRIYRTIPYGPLLDVFVLDMRSYRGPNSSNKQTVESSDTAFIGNTQLDWLVTELKASKATWKVISADMPLSLGVEDGKDAKGDEKWEAVANTDDGAPLGRELEIARLLRNIKDIPNIVWITTDVHYCAAHYYDPAQAQFKDFSPFWEFVAGPLNAGSFGPNKLDKTFGPKVVFEKCPPAPNSSPFAGFQFFGEVNIDPQSKTLSVNLIDLDGVSQFKQTINPIGI
jgi:alkaline phosphatase D